MAAKKTTRAKAKSLAKRIENAVLKEIKSLLGKKRPVRKPAKKAAKKVTRAKKAPTKKAKKK